jgi:hypothetical protein
MRKDWPVKGQVFNLRPISIGLGGRVQMPPRRVDNPPQVDNLPHISILRASTDACFPVVGKLSGIAHECLRHDGIPILSPILRGRLPASVFSTRSSPANCKFSQGNGRSPQVFAAFRVDGKYL